jgi:HK97 family phage prohead protease
MSFPEQDRCAACGKAAAGFLSFRGVRLGVDHADCRNRVARTMPTRSSLAELEVRTVSMADFQVRNAEGAAGIFSGYANRHQTKDTYGTRWQEGAWKAGGLDSDPYPLLWMHDPWDPIGTVKAGEDSTGLEVEGRWDNSDEGKRARDRYESGSAVDLSVGFVTVQKDSKDKGLVTSSKLKEVSQVTTRFGASPGSRIASVRMSETDFDRRAIEGSYEDLQEELRQALQAQFGGGPGTYLWILATFPDRVVYCAGGYADSAGENTWQVTYTEDEAAETFTFGAPEPVEVAQVVQPRAQQNGELEVRRQRELALMQLTVPVLRPARAPDTRATWDAAYINDLPDSAFLYIEDGGEKDSADKTKPRSLRHFPVHDAGGKVDVPHLRNALSRIPQSDLDQGAKDKAMAAAKKLAKGAGIDTGGDSEK